MEQKKNENVEKVNYATEKAEVEKQVKKWKLIVVFSVVGVLLAFCIFGAFVNPSSWKYYFSLPDIDSMQDGECRVHFLDVGQGDCTLVEFPNGQTVMIDGGSGNENSTDYILRYLNALKIKKLDVLLVTNTDADHCGGLATILQYKKVEKVFLPKTLPSVNAAYAAFYSTLIKKEIDWAYAERTANVIDVDECVFSVLYPYMSNVGSSADEQKSNDESVVVWLDYHGTSVLLASDMSTETESILMRDDLLELLKHKGVFLSSTEVLKVSHHGGRYETSAEFLEYLHLQTAVISCGENNTYGHPHEEVLDRLQEANATTYRTDRHGSVVVTMKEDGKYIVDMFGKG